MQLKGLGIKREGAAWWVTERIDRLKLIASSDLVRQTAKAMCTSYKSAGNALDAGLG